MRFASVESTPLVRRATGANERFASNGSVERFASELASNYCMLHSLRQHVRDGGRVYAEGGGLAYLCRQAAVSRREWFPLAGVLPAAAVYQQARSQPRPVELRLREESWMTSRAPKIRGYLDSRWSIQPIAPVDNLAVDPRHQLDLVSCGNVVGSRIHFHLSTQPVLLPLILRDDPREAARHVR